MTKTTKAIGCFVCDMSDLFGVGVPVNWTATVLDVISRQQLLQLPDRFYLLTKQPQNLGKFSPFPDNCWVGVTATNQLAFYEALTYLKNITAKLKYISVEPMLTPITFDPVFLKAAGIGWLIIGAKTKPYEYPEVEWVHRLVEQCDEINLPVFLKDSLRKILPDEAPFYDVCDEDPAGCPFLRQEIPL